ncbi:hypothetical protein FJY68_12820 [candidate division WOR-3 bacterium]|uniref:Uncharacterized protein n=1 Tax=candidate division WOR-3 bacterium TaxID=2052148 RepID=A0A937XGI4_UNCW3|nr:hypothetical protein [candidate division WOR-3 bacterium]
MTRGTKDRVRGRYSIPTIRAARAKLALCAVALGIGVAHAQPFPSFFLDTTRYIGRDSTLLPLSHWPAQAQGV